MEKFTKPELLNFLCEGVGEDADLLSMETTTNGTTGGSNGGM